MRIAELMHEVGIDREDYPPYAEYAKRYVNEPLNMRKFERTSAGRWIMLRSLMSSSQP